MDISKAGESSEPVSTRQVIKFWRSVIKLVGIILELECGSSELCGNTFERSNMKVLVRFFHLFSK